jgi:hypothetical protein
MIAICYGTEMLTQRDHLHCAECVAPRPVCWPAGGRWLEVECWISDRSLFRLSSCTGCRPGARWPCLERFTERAGTDCWRRRKGWSIPLRGDAFPPTCAASGTNGCSPRRPPDGPRPRSPSAPTAGGAPGHSSPRADDKELPGTRLDSSQPDLRQPSKRAWPVARPTGRSAAVWPRRSRRRPC